MKIKQGKEIKVSEQEVNELVQQYKISEEQLDALNTLEIEPLGDN